MVSAGSAAQLRGAVPATTDSACIVAHVHPTVRPRGSTPNGQRRPCYSGARDQTGGRCTGARVSRFPATNCPRCSTSTARHSSPPTPHQRSLTLAMNKPLPPSPQPTLIEATDPQSQALIINLVH
ncbi:hypothetical protein chiPu_0008881 [Chiloscyllium punctatum]|uniref:Uncharacterized protein n=1 Tax=Chiloscyllium punctatum TaxID=137246 RepID=A0A401SJC0_CHIPU|nr:hypothetical protein [Chiloscyllium punctatum]